MEPPGVQAPDEAHHAPICRRTEYYDSSTEQRHSQQRWRLASEPGQGAQGEDEQQSIDQKAALQLYGQSPHCQIVRGMRTLTISKRVEVAQIADQEIHLIDQVLLRKVYTMQNLPR